jgi:hypothetical protein
MTDLKISSHQLFIQEKAVFIEINQQAPVVAIGEVEKYLNITNISIYRSNQHPSE